MFDFGDLKKPIMQKNWNLFTDINDDLFCITDVYPKMKIRKLDINTPRLYGGVEHDMKQFFKNIDKKLHIRCSTNFIKWKSNTLICALHVKKHTLILRSFFFVIKDSFPFEPLAYSKTYTFFNNTDPIEFITCINWNKDNTKIICCVGRGDYKGYNLEIEPSDIEFII